MASKSVKRLGLHQDVVNRLLKLGILTCLDILLMHRSQLQQKTQLNVDKIQDIYKKAANKASPHVTKLSTMIGRSGVHLSTSFPVLDDILHGGILPGSITEFAGPAGCGKTQLAMQISVQATLPQTQGGINSSVLYIDTESAFSPHRLIEIAQSKFPSHFGSENALEQLAAKVHVYNTHTCKAFQERINQLEEDIIQLKIKLIIVDSIASLVRKEFGGSQSAVHRVDLLTKHASSLKNVAEKLNVVVVVTNQITTRFGHHDDGETPQDGEDGSDGYVTPALGNSWSHNVNTRFIMQYLSPPLRQIRIAKSPVAPFVSATYTIEAKGLVQTDHSPECYEGTDPGLQRIQVRSNIAGPQSTFTY